MKRSILPLLLSLALCLGMLPTAALAVDGDTTTGYTINYAEETITIGEGYSLYTAASGGNAIFTASSGNGTTSLTNYIQNTEQKLYLQAPATGEGEQPDRREITIPARPAAPDTSYVSIDYSEEKLVFPSGLTVTTLEYATQQTNPEWKDVPSSAALSEMGWTGDTQVYYYFRTAADSDSFASSSTSQSISVKTRPNAPSDPTLIEVTSNSITIQVVSGQEYRLGSSGTWSVLTGTTGSDGTTNAPEGLTIKLHGVLNNDKVTATGTVAYNTDDVGTGKTITANNIELTGDDAVYYILTHQTATNNGGEITAAALSGTVTIIGTAQYGQQLTASYDPVHDEQVSYQWNRNGQPITGATGDTYTLTAEDVEQSITVTADPAAAKAGETVTLTPTPDAGYEVGAVTVTDRFGDAVEVTENADGTYTFTMPNGQVSVEVTFVEATPEPLPFTDVAESDWFHDAVQYVYDNGLMDGVGEGQFAPNATTNRAMVVTILYRLAGEPDVSGQSDFTDVASGQWYSNAVAWAAEKGIVNGISETEFAPSGDLTREQLATVLYRYAEDQGYDGSASADLSGFPDAGDIQDYATEALSWAVAEGLLQGFEDDSLQPQSTATRAQIATILMRFCETVAK